MNTRDRYSPDVVKKAWQKAAQHLNASGYKMSIGMCQLIKDNINGLISITAVQDILKTYHREEENADMIAADMVASILKDPNEKPGNAADGRSGYLGKKKESL